MCHGAAIPWPQALPCLYRAPPMQAAFECQPSLRRRAHNNQQMHTNPSARGGGGNQTLLEQQKKATLREDLPEAATQSPSAQTR